MFILRFVSLLYLPEEGQICETLNQIQKKNKVKKNMDICPISTWNANTLLVFMCTIVVYTNKSVLKLQQLFEVHLNIDPGGKK